MNLDIQWRAGGIGYLGILRGSNSTKKDSSDKTKAEYFFNPVVATKNTEKVVERVTYEDGEDIEHVIIKAFQCVHVSFHSTSSCNTRTVNAWNYFKMSTMIRERGKFDNRRYQGIDMNEACQLYLVTYSHIESIDNLITNCHMKYRCWKYWHSPMIHAMSLALVLDYDMYPKVAEWDLYQTWNEDNIADFWKCCDLISNQMTK